MTTAVPPPFHPPTPQNFPTSILDKKKGEAIGIQNGEAIGIQKGEAIGIQKGEAIGIQKGEAIGIQKGEAIGIQKGEAIGAQKERVAIIKNMRDSDMTDEQICSIIPLSPQELESIMNS